MQFTGLLDMSTLAWLGGFAAAAVTVLYILKLRKRRIEVPFSPLWQKVLVEQSRDSDWWKRFRRLLSWLLHLVVAGLLVFALADPHSEDEVVQGRHVVLLLDTSASMAATDVSGGVDRLDIAKKRAGEILETMGPEDRVMLVSFDDQLQPLSPFVAEASILEQPLREIEVAATGTSFDEALSFAADSLRGKAHGELVILSDGAGAEEEAFAQVEIDPGTTVRHLKVGESAGNLAITAFNVRRYQANKLDFELFVRVQSFFDRPITAEVQLWADGRQVDTKPLQLEANEVYQRFYPSQAVSGEELEARVKITSSDARDVFPLDDVAYALLPPLERVKVLVVTEGNLYLEGPLLLNPNLEVTRVAPSAYTAQASEAVDVTFFDRVAPADAPAGNVVYIGPEGEGSPWTSSGAVDDPIITQVRKDHPLMRWITFKDLNIGRALRLKTTKGDTAVASAIGVPMLIAREVEGRRSVAFAFDVRNSDLPLRVAFPVLLLNIVDYFTMDDASLVESHATGETWSIAVPDDASEASVTGPEGETWTVPVFDGEAVVYGTKPGFYEVAAGNQTERLAANLANREESEIGPRDLEFPQVQTRRSTDALLFDRRELWIWALLAALLLVMIEWWTYNRRLTV